jgi:hypothetical protein
MDRPPVQIPYPAPAVVGWLLFLCLVLTFACPASILYQTFAHTVPALLSSHSLKLTVLLSVYALLFLGVAAFSFAAGLALWLIKPGAVTLAKRFCLVFLCAHLGYFGFWVLLFRPTHLSRVSAMAWYHVAGPLLPYFLWTVYLEHSKRVRETYSLEN